jgi:hypothetical protein
LPHLLTHMFLYYYHALWCPVYGCGRFCRFAVIHYTVWLPYRHDPPPLIATCTYQCALSAVTLVLAWFSTHTVMSLQVLFFC